MTLQLLYSKFPYIWGKFDFLIISVPFAWATLKLSSAILTCWTFTLKSRTTSFLIIYWQCSYRVVGPTTTTTTTTPTTVIPATTTSPAPKTTAVPVAYNGEGTVAVVQRSSFLMLSKENTPLQVEAHSKARCQRKKPELSWCGSVCAPLMEAEKREYWGCSVLCMCNSELAKP